MLFTLRYGAFASKETKQDITSNSPFDHVLSSVLEQMDQYVYTVETECGVMVMRRTVPTSYGIVTQIWL